MSDSPNNMLASRHVSYHAVHVKVNGLHRRAHVLQEDGPLPVRFNRREKNGVNCSEQPPPINLRRAGEIVQLFRVGIALALRHLQVEP